MRCQKSAQWQKKLENNMLSEAGNTDHFTPYS